MKNELVYHRRYKTREQAFREITEYIEEAWIPIPLLAIGDSLLYGKMQHEKYLVSTIAIRGQYCVLTETLLFKKAS